VGGNTKTDLGENTVEFYGLDSAGSGQGPGAGFCEHGNEPSGFVECWDVLE
jgi:hypothetical protein